MGMAPPSHKPAVSSSGRAAGGLRVGAGRRIEQTREGRNVEVERDAAGEEIRGRRRYQGINLKGAGLRRVYMERALNKLEVTGNRLQGTGSNRRRHPLANDRWPMFLLRSARTTLPSRSVSVLRSRSNLGHATTGLRTCTVLLDDILKAQERVMRPTVSRSELGVAQGELFISDGVLENYHEDAGRKEEELRLIVTK